MTDSEKLDLIISGIQRIETRLENVETRLENVETRLENVETRLENVETELEHVKVRLENVETELEHVKVRLEHVETRVADIELTLENEIRTNIEIIADGHLDLARNLHEAMKPNNEIEVLAVKVTALEGEVRDLKRQNAYRNSNQRFK